MSFSPQMLAPLRLSSDQPGARPDFVGVGTPKAGTSWWFELLLQHPQLVQNNFNVKETCYFCHSWPASEDEGYVKEYLKGFANPDGMLQGEWSTLYFTHPYALDRLLTRFPNTKLLVAFRDPLDTMYSWVNQLLRNRAKNMLVDSDSARYMYMNYDAIPAIFAQIMRYPQILRDLRARAGENLLCLQYEENVRNTQQQYDRTLAFLGLESHTLTAPDKPVNKADSNLLNGLELPENMQAQLRSCGEALIAACPDFSKALWNKAT